MENEEKVKVGERLALPIQDVLSPLVGKPIDVEFPNGQNILANILAFDLDNHQVHIKVTKLEDKA